MTSLIADSWGRIIAWLRANASPESIEPFAPADQALIESFEARTGIRLPQELVEFQAALHVFGSSSALPSDDDWDPMAFTPIPLDEALAGWVSQNELVEMGEFDDRVPASARGIANVWWHRGWMPFAGNGGGDYLCVDTIPADTGVVGQIITHSHESGKHALLAPSLGAYLQDLAAKIERGAFVFDDRYGLMPASVEDNDAGEEPEDTLYTGMTEGHYANALRLGEEAFKNKDYAACVAHLSRFADRLEKLPASRLAFARKKLQDSQ